MIDRASSNLTKILCSNLILRMQIVKIFEEEFCRLWLSYPFMRREYLVFTQIKDPHVKKN